MQGRFDLAETSWPGQTLWPVLGMLDRHRDADRPVRTVVSNLPFEDLKKTWAAEPPVWEQRHQNQQIQTVVFHPHELIRAVPPYGQRLLSWAWPSWILSRWWMRSSRRWLSFPFVSSWHWPLSRMLGRTSGGTRLINSSTICPASYSAGKQITTVDLKLIITSIIKMITVDYNMWPRTTKPIIFKKLNK